MSSSGTTRHKDHSIQSAHNIHYPFWFGGSASCFAAAVTHPLDLSTSARPFSKRTSKRLKANRVNSKGRGPTLAVLKLQLTPSRSAFKPAPQMAPRACSAHSCTYSRQTAYWVFTAVYVLPPISVHEPLFQGQSAQTLLNLPLSALRLPTPPTYLLHHPLRHLLRAQRYIHDRTLVSLPPLLDRHGQHLWLSRRYSR